jgi:hypothetical protein
MMVQKLAETLAVMMVVVKENSLVVTMVARLVH